MATTAVIRIQKINFRDRVYSDGKTVKGGAQGLWAIKKHNERLEVNRLYECKSKQSTNIDTTKSKDNIYVKRMAASDINEIKEQGKLARPNASCAFEIVIDFQDLTEEEKADWDPSYHIDLIQNYFEKLGLEEFKQIAFAVHLNDEKNPHIHAVYSGYSKKQEKFNINGFFNPEIGEPVVDANNEIMYKKHNRGKLKGQFMLDSEGNKIPKRKALNGADFLQSTWSMYLDETNKEPGAPQYRQDKEFASFFYYTDGVYRKFSEETKERISIVREAERDYHHLRRDGYDEEKNELKEFILKEFADINGFALDEAHNIFEEKQENKQKKLAMFKTIAPNF